MNRPKTLLLLFWGMLLHIITNAPVAATTVTDLGGWRDIMNSTATTNVFDAINDSTPIWPAVHSPECLVGMEDAKRQEQAEYHAMAHRIIHDASLIIDQIPTCSASDNQRRLDAVLSLRDNMLVNPGYANQVLADGLTRVGVAFLCQELGSERQISFQFEKALSRLTYNIDLVQWENLAKEELGWSSEKLKEVESAPSLEAGLHKLWDLLSNDDDFVFPRNIRHMWCDDLLKQRDLSLLLHRYINSGLMLKQLSLAVQYKKKTVDFSLTDDEGKIGKVIVFPTLPPDHKIFLKVIDGKPQVVIEKVAVSVDKTQLSVGERFIGGQVSSYSIAHFLHAIKVGDIDKLLFLEHPKSRRNSMLPKSPVIPNK
jgi:hypothetical protein